MGADPLRFHPEIAADIEKAIRHYDNISSELGNRFRSAVDDCFDRIEDNPNLFPFAFEDVRFVRTRGFPYVIQYRLVREVPEVLGVYHGASDPAHWRR